MDRKDAYIALLEQEMCRAAIHALRLSAEITQLKMELADIKSGEAHTDEADIQRSG